MNEKLPPITPTAVYHRTGYALANAQLHITAVNSVLTEWLHLPAEQVVGQPLDLLFPEVIGAEENLLTPAYLQHTPYFIPHTHRHLPNGEERFFDLQVEVFTAVGDTTLLVTFTDVTWQAQQEQKLRQQRNDLHLLSEQLRLANEQLAYLLKHFVPEAVAQNLIRLGTLPTLGAEKQCEATVLFADMRNFTALSEHMPPAETMDVLNAYLAVLAQAIRQYKGSVIQIVGDMIMAVFNVNQAQPDHVERGVAAALEMQQQVIQFAAQHAQWPGLAFGVGVHTGVVTAGYLGVSERYRYAVVGDTTNVAFHLCSRAAAEQIIISETIYQLLTNKVEAQPLGPVYLKQRKQPLLIYELHNLHQP